LNAGLIADSAGKMIEVIDEKSAEGMSIRPQGWECWLGYNVCFYVCWWAGGEEACAPYCDYAMCGVAALVQVQDGAVVEARTGSLSVNDTPTVVDLSGVLAGGVDDETLAAAGEAALAQLDPGDDIHATAAYRAQLVRVLTARVLRSAHEDALRRSA
jgi:hypothetical protein